MKWRASLVLVFLAVQGPVRASAQDAGTDAAQTQAEVATTLVALNVELAEVSLNGKAIGKSPLRPQRLQPGDIIAVQKAGFVPLRYEHDGRSNVVLFLERLEPLEPLTASGSDFPWLWVGVGAGAAAAVAVAVIIAASAADGSEEGIPIPEIQQ